MMKEVKSLGNSDAVNWDWESRVVYSNLAGALEDLFGLYGVWHSATSSSLGAFEATSLMRPCDGSKRGLRSERVGRGVRSEPVSGDASACASLLHRTSPYRSRSRIPGTVSASVRYTSNNTMLT